MGKDQQPAAVEPVIHELVLTTAGTEYPQVLHDGGADTPSIKKIQIKCRTSADITYGFVSAGTVVTLPADHTYWQDGLDNRGLTVYIIGGVNGLVAEIEVWT